MFLIYGQFYNQTKDQWDWQQIGGNAITLEDAKQYAHGFAQTYNTTTKVITRKETFMYLPPVPELDWPEIVPGMLEN